VAVAPKPPAKHLRGDDDDDDDDDEEELVRSSHNISNSILFTRWIGAPHKQLSVHSVEVQNTSNNNLVEETNFHIS
jgi:hypothetical protein